MDVAAKAEAGETVNKTVNKTVVVSEMEDDDTEDDDAEDEVRRAALEISARIETVCASLACIGSMVGKAVFSPQKKSKHEALRRKLTVARAEVRTMGTRLAEAQGQLAEAQGQVAELRLKCDRAQAAERVSAEKLDTVFDCLRELVETGGTDKTAITRKTEKKTDTRAKEQPDTSAKEQPDTSAKEQPDTSAKEQPDTSAKEQPTADQEGNTFGAGNHKLKPTGVNKWYDQSDIDCPNCERLGPTRVTGHLHCSECAFCVFCSFVNPCCEPRNDESSDDEDYLPEGDLTPAQLAKRKSQEAMLDARRQQAVVCAEKTEAGKKAQADFYAWKKLMFAD